MYQRLRFEHDFRTMINRRISCFGHGFGGPMRRLEYKWKGNDLSSFLHVFWKDALWSHLPIDCVLMVMKHCKTHPVVVHSTMRHAYDMITLDFVGLYPTESFLNRCKVEKTKIILSSLVESSERAVHKKKHAPCKKNYNGGMKNCKRQPNRAMRKR